MVALSVAPPVALVPRLTRKRGYDNRLFSEVEEGNFCHFSKLLRFAFSRLSETDAKAKRVQAKILLLDCWTAGLLVCWPAGLLVNRYTALLCNWYTALLLTDTTVALLSDGLVGTREA